MTIPFYTGNIIEPLKTLLEQADNEGDFEPVLDFCRPLIATTTDDGVILSYTFAQMEQALAIYVDDVLQMGKECLELLKRLNHEYGGTSQWKRMIKRIIKEAETQVKKENKLLSKDYNTLTVQEKTKLAYNLSNSNSIENISKAAAIHKDLLSLKKDAEIYYHLGQYIICLYKSHQVELADVTFYKFAQEMAQNPTHGYAFLVNICFENKLMAALNDAEKLQQVWQEAFAHPAFTDRNDFPVFPEYQDKVLLAAHQFHLLEIKNYLIKCIKNRKPRLISAQVREII